MPEVRLRPIRISDAAVCFRWVTDPDVARHLGLVQPPRTEAEERAWIARALAYPRQERAFIIEDATGRPIGTCTLRGIDREAGSAYLGLMIGEKHLWDHGYGSSATRALLAYAFGELSLQQVRLSCHRDNCRALRCYQKAGFSLSKRRNPDPSGYTREVHMEITRACWEGLAGGAAPKEDGS